MLKPIPHMQGYYASTEGDVYTTWDVNRLNGCMLCMRKVRTRTENRSGYICFSAGGRQHRVHVCVLAAFAGSRRSGHVVRHLDGNPRNNEVSNLSYGTQAQNCRDMIRHGRSTRGEDNPQAKLSRVNVQAIRQAYRNGVAGKELAASYGVSQSSICDIVKGRTWK